MKINTKACVAIQGSPVTKEEAMIQPNKYIPAEATAAATKKTTTNANPVTPSPAKEEEEGGRKVMYEAKIIYTPVLTSGRHQKKKSPARRLVSEDDMAELNKKLEDLFVKDDTNTEAETDISTDSESLSLPSVDDKEAKVKEEAVMPKDIDDKPLEEPSLMGRMYKTVFNYRTCESSKVKRSSRVLVQELENISAA